MTQAKNSPDERLLARRPKRYTFRFPKPSGDLTQDEEWCEVHLRDGWKRFRFHDYAEIYTVPALYESLFYRKLKCTSPHRVVSLLRSVLRDVHQSPEQLRVLDVGAGNGMVGQELRAIGAEHIVGIDIIPEAATATARDRPGVYDAYHVADLTDLDTATDAELAQDRFNCLTTVAALGFGDIPPLAFMTAYEHIRTGGWLAFNIKEDSLEGADDTGFSRFIRGLIDAGAIRMHAYRRYCHRLSVTGDRLFYVAMIAQKVKQTPPEVAARIHD
ncbi:MAG: methyltransferase domain-containing protein [Phycisphaeraceae bacterium]|nr:methyltransferase domain-containing protein [Phycisphaerales bacterium]MCB9842960.1 methyltransferase domain-containing protein [Phycisphaeraceae bacterium]